MLKKYNFLINIATIFILISATPVFSNFMFDSLDSNVQKVDLLSEKDLFFAISEDIDNITINLISPTNNSIHNGGTLIVIEFLDENSSIIQPITELYKWDNNPNFESILRPLPMEDGIHHLYVEVEDQGGTWFDSHFVFYSDNVAPTITLNSPENGTHYGSDGNIQLWTSSYPSGALNSIISEDVNNDNNSDVLVGGSSRRVYAFDGFSGQNEWQTIEFPSQINHMTNIDDSRFVIGLSGGEIFVLSTGFGSTIHSNISVSSNIVSILYDEVTQSILVEHDHLLRLFNYSLHEQWSINFSSTDFIDLVVLKDVNTDGFNDIITINQSSFVRIFNQTNGVQVTNYTLDQDIESVIADGSWLYTSFSNGFVRRYNSLLGSLDWQSDIETGQVIWKIEKFENSLICSSGSGKIFKLSLSGSLSYSKTISPTYIKNFIVNDFDGDSKGEILSIDGNGVLYNYDLNSGNNSWDNNLGKLVTDFTVTDITNNTFENLILVTGDGSIFAFDPRATLPKLIPAWTNVSFSYDDAITGNKTFWEKYSWDGAENSSAAMGIPSSSGIHTLEVWVSDNASNVAYNKYQFFSVIELILNSPENNSYQQGNTPINITLSEIPLQQKYSWDGGVSTGFPAPIPNSETSHTLDIYIKDQSQNIRTFKLFYVTDNTPIVSINLVSPVNNTVVEGGEDPIIQYSEAPFLQFYNWNGNENTTDLESIPGDSDTHMLNVYVADAALNWKVTKYVFHTKIQIELISHTNDSVVSPNALFNFTFGEIPDICQYEIDNTGILNLFPSNTSILVLMPSTSISHMILIRVNDSVNGRWNEEIYTFKTRITVNLTSHENGTFAETGDVVNVTFSDPPITKLFSWDGQKNSSRLPRVPSPDGFHYFNIYVGNIEGDFWHYYFEFNVDTDLIDVLLISPKNNSRINSWQDISFTFSETPFNTLFQWDNSTPTQNYSVPPIIDGIHTLNITVFDEASNVNSKLFLWIIDDTPIDINLNLFDNDSIVYSGETPNITFSEDPIVVWYSWDSEIYSPDPLPAPWKNDTRELNVTVYDGLNWNIKLFNLTIIDIPPIVTVLEANRTHSGNSPILVNINENISNSWHKWDNTSQIDGLIIFTPSVEGSHVLFLHVVDLGGSYTDISVSILVDITPISIISVDPKNNSNVKGEESVNISFSEAPFSISYSWNGGPRTGNVSTIPFIEGETMILNIRAFDEAGNVLDTNILYKIPSEIEQNSPFIFGMGLSIVTVGIIVFIFREKINNFRKKYFKVPKKPE